MGSYVGVGCNALVAVPEAAEKLHAEPDLGMIAVLLLDMPYVVRTFCELIVKVRRVPEGCNASVEVALVDPVEGHIEPFSYILPEYKPCLEDPLAGPCL